MVRVAARPPRLGTLRSRPTMRVISTSTSLHNRAVGIRTLWCPSPRVLHPGHTFSPPVALGPHASCGGHMATSPPRLGRVSQLEGFNQVVTSMSCALLYFPL